MQESSLTGTVELNLPEFDSPPAEPLPLLRNWLALAKKYRVREPKVAVLATIGESGPSTRTVLIKDIDDAGLILTTSCLSRKGQELLGDPRCSINLYWRETMQQITISGQARPCASEQSDNEFALRPKSARAIAIATTQSAVLHDEAALRRKVAKLQTQQDLIRPATWHAWRVVPSEVEFWHGSTDRFHRRLVFRRNGDGLWEWFRLQP